jgi:hypothetical protein
MTQLSIPFQNLHVCHVDITDRMKLKYIVYLVGVASTVINYVQNFGKVSHIFLLFSVSK